MKRIGTMLMAGLLLLGLAQCKKEITENLEELDPNEGVYITVNVNGGSKGLRADVDPNAPEGYATVSFEEGDKLYLFNKGSYRGYLTYDGEKFSSRKKLYAGSGDYLHFYFVGSFDTEPVLKEAVKPNLDSNHTFTVNIADQTDRYPVIAYGHSTNMYTEETSSYDATLDIYCSIMKIPIEGASIADTVTLHNMKNVVSCNMDANWDKTTSTPITANPFTFPETSYGEIKLHAESPTERWAIVLPQRAVLAQLSCDGFQNAIVSVPEITADRYYDDDVSGVTLTPGTPSDSRFSVAPNTQVCFSPGNLQAVFAEANNQSCTWQFAEHQYDYVGDAVANTAVGIKRNATQNIVSTPGTVDLFGWVGQSAEYATAYGICNIFFNTYYGGDDEPLKSDWGVPANAASLGGHNTWYTPSMAELVYLVNTRATNTTINGVENARYTAATINTDGTPVKGIILFPDDYAGPTSNAEANPMGITFGRINKESKGECSSWGTQCTISGWKSLEFAGCVFLPAAGERRIDNPEIGQYELHSLYTICLDSEVLYASDFGLYWSSTSMEQTLSRCLEFNGGGCYPPETFNTRGTGGSVRLVRPAD